MVEGYDELRESIQIEKDNAAKTADRLNRYNSELEKKLKQIIPGYEVNYIIDIYSVQIKFN